MTRFLFVLAVIGFGGLGGAACNKPSADECRQAIANMEKLLGTEAASRNVDNEGEVRRCRGGSSKAAVTCAGKATSADELRACAFMTPKNAASATKPTAPASPPSPAPTAPPTPPAPPAPDPATPSPANPPATR